jgi:hypothetical protein
VLKGLNKKAQQMAATAAEQSLESHPQRRLKKVARFV